MRFLTLTILLILSNFITAQKIQQPDGNDNNEKINYYIPNSFTPNNDEYNQTFGIVFNNEFEPEEFHMTIFNRWGSPIWESHDLTNKWDGTYQNNTAQPGVYSWEINFKSNNQTHQIRGYLNLLK